MSRTTKNSTVGRDNLATVQSSSMSGIPIPEKFDGALKGQDATYWFNNLERVATLRKWGDQEFVTAFPLFLEGVAHGWFNSLAQEHKDTKAHIKAAFTGKFQLNEQQKQDRVGQFFTMKQGPTEKSDRFIDRMTTFAADLGLGDASIRAGITAGLRDDVQRQVRLQRPTTLEDLSAIATAVESSPAQPAASTEALIDVIASLRKDMKEQQDQTRQEIAALQNFTISMVSAPTQGTTTGQHTNRGKAFNSYQGRSNFARNNNFSGQQSNSVLCYCCGIAGHLARDCKHRNKVCNICKKVGHLARACRHARLQGHNDNC